MGAFALASIRVPLWRAAFDARAIAAGDTSPLHLPIKRKGYAFLQQHAQRLHAEALELRGDPVGQLLLFSRVPGLGLAKAGFLTQLAFGAVGCLDSHNLKRFGIDAGRFHLNARSTEALRERKAIEYASLCEALGGCESLWDTWCNYVATQSRDARRYSGAWDVSATHCRALGLPIGKEDKSSGDDTGTAAVPRAGDHRRSRRQGTPRILPQGYPMGSRAVVGELTGE